MVWMIRRLAPLCVASASGVAAAQGGVLEEIVVTAQKREQNIQDVPISIASLSELRLAAKFTGGETILALAGTVPGLYAESSNGRHSPRFYMRGLGNADFDQAASQPVSVVFDDVPMELVILKAFPLFDLADVEVIRGPQGTLFGRNTTAGILKFDTKRPEEAMEGFARAAAGNLGTRNGEAALSGLLGDGPAGRLMGRISLLAQNRRDWIDNAYSDERNAFGGHREWAGRAQLLWEPSDNSSFWLMHQRWRLDGHSATAFRANILSRGSNKLNDNYRRGTVHFQGGGGNPAEVDAQGTTLRAEWELGAHTLSSITSYQDAAQFARGDIDGGAVHCTFSRNPATGLLTPNDLSAHASPAGITSARAVSLFCDDPNHNYASPAPPVGPSLTWPGHIFISSDTGTSNSVQQFTQELHIASQLDGRFNYQAGVFYFSDQLTTSTEFGTGPGHRDTFTAAIAFHENTSWAVFGQGFLDLTDRLSLTAGLRYTDDEKGYQPTLAPFAQPTIRLADEAVSWNLNLAYALGDDAQAYARIASGFRAPSIQARNVAFGAPATTAGSENILSYEAGVKAELIDRRLRLNATAFHYRIDDMQLTAIGGGGNFTTLLNAAEGIGYGVEVDIDWWMTQRLMLSGGFGYNHTELNDPGLSVAPCSQCTILDPLNARGQAIIDGNPFQHAPQWTLNLELSYSHPLPGGNELFLFTDWKFKGDTNEFLYESVEFDFAPQFEGGLRAGYRDNRRNFELALFARNLTNEHNATGGIDFSNNASYVNEPRIWGVEGVYRL